MEAKDGRILLQNKVDSLTLELDVANKLKEDLERECRNTENEVLKLKAELEARMEQHVKTNVDVASQYDQDETEMQIVSLVSAFLFDHPRADLDYICLHLKGRLSNQKEVIENVMRKYPRIFQESSPNEWTCVSVPQEMLAALISGNDVFDFTVLDRQCIQKGHPYVYRYWKVNWSSGSIIKSS